MRTPLANLSASSESGTRLHPAFAWCLWPGVALYSRLNGSLLFGGGFGDIGNAAQVILGSAAAWSVPLALFFQRPSRIRDSRRRR